MSGTANWENSGMQNRRLKKFRENNHMASMENIKNRNEKAYAEFKRVPMALQYADEMRKNSKLENAETRPLCRMIR